MIDLNHGSGAQYGADQILTDITTVLGAAIDQLFRPWPVLPAPDPV
jgi:hypothetical protein